MTTLICSVLFGSIGGAYFIYGKKQRRAVPFVAGVALIVFPYFVANAWAAGSIGVALTSAPWFLRA